MRGLLLATLSSQTPPFAYASRQNAESQWRLPKSMYPAGARILVQSPTDANAESDQGRFQRHLYYQLGRISGRGWIQQGAVVRYSEFRGKPVRHLLYWGYVVSYYRSPAAAANAVNDVVGKIHVHSFTQYGIRGLVVPRRVGVYRITLNFLPLGSIVVQQECYKQVQNKFQYAHVFATFCTRQRMMLERILAAQQPPVGTAQPQSRPRRTNAAVAIAEAVYTL